MKKFTITILIILFSLTTVFAQYSADSLIVFVGEKIEVKYFPRDWKKFITDTIIRRNDTSYIWWDWSFDRRYLAKYRILQKINGCYSSDTIEFIVFDHNGTPAFSKYQHVLLFVSYHKGKLYHEKYQFFDLYLTQDDKWASPYTKEDYEHPYKDSITVKPEKISFKVPISYPIKKESLPFMIDKFTNEPIIKYYLKPYPEPYYEIKGDTAYVIYGNYVEELFKLKQQTILKARGLY